MRVALADDSALLREGIARILADDGITVTAAVADGPTLLTHLAHLAADAPDLAILDIRMPPTFSDEGLRAARLIRQRHRGTAILLLSQHVQVGGVLDLFTRDAAGLGYLLKDRIIEIDDFLAAVRRTAAGGCAIDPAVVRALVERRGAAEALDALSERELEVLRLMAEGLSNSAIAGRIVISIRTVETHVASIFTKLGLLPTPEEHRRVRAVLLYLNPPWTGPGMNLA